MLKVIYVEPLTEEQCTTNDMNKFKAYYYVITENIEVRALTLNQAIRTAVEKTNKEILNIGKLG